MPRKRRAWLTNQTGKRVDRGRELPGYYVFWRERRQYRSRHFDRKSDAVKYRDSLNRRFERLAAGGLLPVTLEDATEAFIESCGRLAAKTQLEMATTLGWFTRLVGKDFEVAACEAEHVDRYLRHQLAQAAESTAAKHVRYLRRFFRWCIDRGYAYQDPTRALTVNPRPGVRHIPIPNDEQIGTMLAAIDDDVMRLAAAIGLTTGLDRGVIASLTTANFDAGMIVTRRTKTARSRPVEIRVPVHASIRLEIERLCSEAAPGLPLFRNYFRRSWYRAAKKKAGHPWVNLTVADFRKIASARLQRIGLSTAHVQQILGHASIQTTARHYTPLDPEALRAFDRLTLPLCEDSTQATQRKPA